MDQLEAWAVRGRVATAIRSMREDLLRLAVDSQELTEALAEAEQLGEPGADMRSIATAAGRVAHGTARPEAVRQ
jgi:hypothetical protein